MDHSPRLNLPLLAAGQSQKHVTHNEALIALDAMVALHLEALDEATPPDAPSLGAAYGLGPSPGGAWAGRPGDIAVFDGFNWMFSSPRKGWTASVGAGSEARVHDGVAWKPLIATDPLMVQKLGVGATPDADNPVAMATANLLLTAPATTGSIRVKVNRGSATDIGSLLFQTGYTGEAELGLLGGHGFALKVSDGVSPWRVAICCKASTARPDFPEGIDGRSGSPDLLINGDFRLNRRGAAAGPAAAQSFVADRWRAAAGGAVWAVTGEGFRLISGAIEQLVEPGMFGLALSAGAILDCTAEGLAEGSAQMTIQGETATLSSATPRASFTLTQAVAGPLTVRVASSGGAVTFRRLRLHPRMPAIGEAVRRPDEDESLASRYYFSTLPTGFSPGQPATSAPGTVCTPLGLFYTHIAYPAAMVRPPLVKVYNPSSGAQGTWQTGGGTAVSPVVDGSDRGVAIYGGGAEAGTLIYGHLTADAEPGP